MDQSPNLEIILVSHWNNGTFIGSDQQNFVRKITDNFLILPFKH